MVNLPVRTWVAALFQGCNPFKNDPPMTYSNFILVNESGTDLWINNKRYHPNAGDSGLFVQNGNHILLGSDAESSTVHPFPSAVFLKIEAYIDSAGVPKLIYRQEPIVNEKWVHEKLDNFSSTYSLIINKEDLIK